MNVILTKSVTVIQRDTLSANTLPVGSVVEISYTPSSFFVEVEWKRNRYSLIADDLAEACAWEDAERIGLGRAV